MYWIVTDSAIDMPKSWIDQQENLRILNLSYILDGVSYISDGTDESIKAIYNAMREGKMLKTSQVTPEMWEECFRELLSAGHDVLTIAFSSGLSGTCSAAFTAAEDVRADYPDRKLLVIDSLQASAGEGLMVHYALENRVNGMSIEENAAWISENVQNFIAWFTVNDLMHLHRGGRVSAASAIVGSLVRIKPMKASLLYMKKPPVASAASESWPKRSSPILSIRRGKPFIFPMAIVKMKLNLWQK